MLIKIMGLLLFTVGLVVIVLATFVIFNLLNMLGPIERWVVFASGIVLCVIGFMMARTEEEITVASDANNHQEIEGAESAQVGHSSTHLE